jgi:4-amino-4-deoxy-L-arabinose transferase-like glycosyltransferase
MHAEIARELLAEGDGVTLRLNGVRYVDKPPLLYWLTALGFRLWGPGEWAARLWPLVGALGAVAGTAFLGARLGGPRAGLVAGLALLTCAGFYAYGRYLRPETLFVAAIQWGFALLLLGRAVSPRLAVLGLGALALASLAKDPLGTLGPLAAVALALWWAGRLRPLSAWLPPPGLLLLALPLAWYLLVEVETRGFLWYTVVDNHLLNLVMARRFPDEDVPLGSLEFLLVGGLGAFPWVLPAALTVAALLRRRAWREPAEAPWVALALWAGAVFALFALAPFKLPHYGLPAYPALALLAARWWEEGRAVRPVLALHLAAFALVALGAWWTFASDGRGVLEGIFGATDVFTRKEAAAGQGPPIPPWEDLKPLLGGTALVFGAGSVGLLVALARGARRPGLAVVLLTLLAWLPLVASAGALVSAARAVRGLALEVGRQAGPGDLLVHEGPIENSGALEFYSGRRPVILDGRVSVLAFGATFREAREIFWERAEVAAAWRSPRRVWLLSTRPPARSLVSDLSPAEVRLVAEAAGRRLYMNRP